MTNWTDERVAERLAKTFAAHESDADPAVAQRIARTTPPAPRRQGALLAAAVAVVLVVGLTTYVVHDRTPGVVPTPAVTPTATPAIAGTNRTSAVAEAARVLSVIPVPPGSAKAATAPVRRLEHLGSYTVPVDPSLTRTNWWVVPLSYADLVSWYAAHTPANTGSAYGPDSTAPAPHGDLDWQLRDASPAYSSPAVVISYARLGAHRTAIRTDVTLAARYDRTVRTRVPDTVTSIDITRSAIDGAATPPRFATVTDPAVVSSVIAAFNNLGGAFAHTVGAACGSPVGIVHVYDVSFHWPGHTLAVDPGAALCGIGMGLTLDGTKLQATLEDSDSFDAVLGAALE